MPAPGRTTNPTLVDERVRAFIAEGGGMARHSSVANRLSPSQRALLPVVLSSGAYAVEMADGGITVRLRDSA